MKIFILKMSGIRPQQPGQPEQTTTTTTQPPVGADVVSVEKLWRIGIFVSLALTILLVGYFMFRAYWRYFQHKLFELARRQQEQDQDDLQQQQQQEVDSDVEPVEVPKPRKQTIRRR
ncbi:MAG: hypothetical protein K2Q45_02400 [Nitrosomonas sp.]|nr:hypothetical protein [Nitrosomonas sp.]